MNQVEVRRTSKGRLYFRNNPIGPNILVSANSAHEICSGIVEVLDIETKGEQQFFTGKMVKYHLPDNETLYQFLKSGILKNSDKNNPFYGCSGKHKITFYRNGLRGDYLIIHKTDFDFGMVVVSDVYNNPIKGPALFAETQDDNSVSESFTIDEWMFQYKNDYLLNTLMSSYLEFNYYSADTKNEYPFGSELMQTAMNSQIVLPQNIYGVRFVELVNFGLYADEYSKTELELIIKEASEVNKKATETIIRMCQKNRCHFVKWKNGKICLYNYQ